MSCHYFLCCCRGSTQIANTIAPIVAPDDVIPTAAYVLARPWHVSPFKSKSPRFETTLSAISDHSYISKPPNEFFRSLNKYNISKIEEICCEIDEICARKKDDINELNGKGETPLDVATKISSSIASCLLAHGARYADDLSTEIEKYMINLF